MGPRRGNASAGGSSEFSVASPRRRGMKPIMNFEGYLGTDGEAPSDLIGLVDAHFHPGGRSWDKTADQLEGPPTSDAGSMRPAMLRAHLRGVGTSAVGAPRGEMGPLLVANVLLASRFLMKT